MFIDLCERMEQLRLLRHSEAEKLAYERFLDRKVTLPPLPPEPGVYEDEIHPPGEHWYKILMPSGKVGTVRVPDELWDESLLPNLVRRFEAKTRRHLKVI